MCTVVTSFEPGRPAAILAVRDEFEQRAFDDPDAWWPGQPSVVGGRDRSAGGSWCVSDIETGVTALVLNRPEKFTGSPSRGLLPLLAVEHGLNWTANLDHLGMASFTLVLVAHDGVIAWEWDGQRLAETDLTAGLHVFTPHGVDPDDARSRRLTPRLQAQPWRNVLAQEAQSDSEDALFVRRDVDGAVYGTVFAQFIDAQPGSLRITYSRAPWLGEWTDRQWT